MNLTNKNNFPEALVRAIQADPYSKGEADFSITELLKPSRQRALQIKHRADIVEDVEDRLYSLYGQIIHGVLERANETDLVEKRFFAEYRGKMLSGQIDSLVLVRGLLTDWKFTTSWGFKTNSEPKPEWTAQLNMQAELLRANGIEVSELQIVGLLRDHNLREARSNPDYPQSQVAIQKIEMWPSEKTRSFIEMRISEHLAAEENLPECSSEERWAKPDVFAVVKGKRAINGGVQFSQETAEKICAANPGTRVEFRKGESMRCALYCNVSEFCTQFKNEKKGTDE